MTARTSAACAIRVEDVYRDGERKVWFVGPFMPHVGSAATSAQYELSLDENKPEGVITRHQMIVTLYLAPGESDLNVMRGVR